MSTSCDNCGASTDATYCPRCGQPVTSIDMPATEFAKEIANEVFALDSRASLTLRLLFRRPGAVATEYVAGHRARFVPPIRLYLMASFLMFLILSLGSGLQIGGVDVNGRPLDLTVDTTQATGEGAEATGEVDTPGTTERAVGEENPTGAGEARDFRTRFSARMEEGLRRGSEDLAGFSDRILNRLAQSMFLLLPAFAGILKLTYRRRLYVHHAIFAIYFHAFVFLLTAAVALPNTLGLPRVSMVTDFVLLLVPFHLVFAMKRFYRESWPRTIFKWVWVSTLYMILGSATLLGILVLSILTA